MEAEYWILSILAVAVALVAGFLGGRMSSASQRQVERMARERDEAREEAENVRAEVNRHFEESARMFGRLASDYRTFFQQFARTAQNLGLSEGRARELLQQADPSLVADRSSGGTGSAASGERADAAPDEAARRAAAAAGEPVGPSPRAASASAEADSATPAPGDADSATPAPGDEPAQPGSDAAEPEPGSQAAADDQGETGERPRGG